MIEFLAVLMILIPLANTYFVADGFYLYFKDPQHSPLLLAFLFTKTVVWLIGLFFGVVAYRYLRDIEPVFPYDGMLFAAVIVTLNLLPGAIHLAIRRYERH